MSRKQKPNPYDIDDLREVLGEVIDNLRAGTTSPAVANATSNAVGKLLSTVRLQMDYYKLSGQANGAIRMLESGQ